MHSSHCANAPGAACLYCSVASRAWTQQPTGAIHAHWSDARDGPLAAMNSWVLSCPANTGAFGLARPAFVARHYCIKYRQPCKSRGPPGLQRIWFPSSTKLCTRNAHNLVFLVWDIKVCQPEVGRGKSTRASASDGANQLVGSVRSIFTRGPGCIAAVHRRQRLHMNDINAPKPIRQLA